jgi:hypothetical protein
MFSTSHQIFANIISGYWIERGKGIIEMIEKKKKLEA